MNSEYPNITIVIKETAAEAAMVVADKISQVVHDKPDCVLGLATGGTPIPVYQQLISRFESNEISFAETTSFNLDEYEGLQPDHPQSFRYFMEEQLFGRTDFASDQTFFPADAGDRYENQIREAGGIDLQLLGIGSNGHIAFNEPGSAKDSCTRWVDLTEETIQSNARFFDHPSDVPKRAISMGIGTILAAKEIILLATGPKKAEAIRQSVAEPPSEQCPASFLQQHAAVTFVLDRAAAAGLG